MQTHHNSGPHDNAIQSAPPVDPTRKSNPISVKSKRHWARTFGVTILIMLVVGAAGLGGAEYYTAKPAFCGTCHIMDSYYQSWSKDLHGAKLGVRCVDCHYAPGERHTVMAKFKGLSQVASYFSGRYGSSRPRAHVANASCLMSGCHGDEAFKNKLLLIGDVREEKRFVGDVETIVTRKPTVQFFHYKHMDATEKLGHVSAELQALEQRLASVLTPEMLERVKAASKSIASAGERAGAMARLCKELGMSEAATGDAIKLLDAARRQTRLRQLDGLSCSSCHNYDATGSRHLTVNRQVCFTCHFTNEPFNRGTGECLKCHEPPTRSILIHETTTSQGSQPVLMEHADIVRRGIDCASCHLDVVRGETRVTARDCARCHDQDVFLADFEKRDTAKVEEYHAVHVNGQKARCDDCHRAVEHGLIDPMRIGKQAEFLEPIRNDCQHCHPNHHTEQVNLLTGTGGAGLDRPMPNSMMGSRLNCRACHTEPAEDLKGDALVRATQQACITCHSRDYAQVFEQWKHEIQTYVDETDAILRGLESRLDHWKGQGRELPPRVKELVDRARHNVRLVRVGGGLHNKPFSLRLLDIARRDLDDAANLLSSE